MSLRRERTAEVRRKGKSLSREREMLQDEVWFRAHLTPRVADKVLGKKFTTVVETELRPLRNAIAHGLLDADPSAFLSDDDVVPWLPVVKRIAHQLVTSEATEQLEKEL